MKIFSAQQIRDWDNYTIAHSGISSIDLMERAAGCCATWISQHNVHAKPVRIFCGKGNNGGDGLAIGRQLSIMNIPSAVYILEFGKAGTQDFQTNLQRLHQYTKDIHFIQDEKSFPPISPNDLVIDALYGTGLNRPISGVAEALIHHINKSNAVVISIDMPSGMFADLSSLGNPIIQASYSLTFQAMKLCFLLPENDQFVGDIEVFDIGLNPQYLRDTFTPYEVASKELIKSLYKPRNKFAHKGTFGHALIVAGSKGKMGAAILASKACLRAGAGLVTTAVSSSTMDVIQMGLPEAMATIIEGEEPAFKNYAAIGLGPGIGTTATAIELISTVLKHIEKPIVIDADGLNILSQNKNLLRHIPAKSIFTPHPKEFERLFGNYNNQFDRLNGALEHARLHQCYIIIKGHYTFIASPGGKGYFNSTGNAGMATAGSGDVLTGIITALLAQGYSSFDATVLGVYIHGLAGDISAARLSEESIIAGDIVEDLGAAFKTIAQY